MNLPTSSSKGQHILCATSMSSLGYPSNVINGVVMVTLCYTPRSPDTISALTPRSWRHEHTESNTAPRVRSSPSKISLLFMSSSSSSFVAGIASGLRRVEDVEELLATVGE